MSAPLPLQGQVAAVTGAASGIGLAIAESLAASGARVVLADLRLADARREADRLAEAGHLAHPFAADVSREHDMEGLVAFAEEVGGALHGVVNNAGIGGVSAPTGTYPVDNWRQVIDINLTGVFFGIRYAVPALKRAGGGAIVNVASILGSVGLAQSPAYEIGRAHV